MRVWHGEPITFQVVAIPIPYLYWASIVLPLYWATLRATKRHADGLLNLCGNCPACSTNLPMKLTIRMVPFRSYTCLECGTRFAERQGMQYAAWGTTGASCVLMILFLFEMKVINGAIAGALSVGSFAAAIVLFLLLSWTFVITPESANQVVEVEGTADAPSLVYASNRG